LDVEAHAASTSATRIEVRAIGSFIQLTLEKGRAIQRGCENGQWTEVTCKQELPWRPLSQNPNTRRKEAKAQRNPFSSVSRIKVIGRRRALAMRVFFTLALKPGNASKRAVRRHCNRVGAIYYLSCCLVGHDGRTSCVWVTTAHSLPVSFLICVCHTMVVLPR